MELKNNRTEERKNRFSGESIMLTPAEAIKHDRIFINELAATLEDKQLGTGGSKLWEKVLMFIFVVKHASLIGYH